jgi:hypothetical protein
MVATSIVINDVHKPRQQWSPLRTNDPHHQRKIAEGWLTYS